MPNQRAASPARSLTLARMYGRDFVLDAGPISPEHYRVAIALPLHRATDAAAFRRTAREDASLSRPTAT